MVSMSRSLFLTLFVAATNVTSAQYLDPFTAYQQPYAAPYAAPVADYGASAFYPQAYAQPAYNPGMAYDPAALAQQAYGFPQANPMQGGQAPSAFGRCSAPVPNPVPTDPGVETMDVHSVQQCVSSGQCILVDNRGDDRSSGTIAGAVHAPANDPGNSFLDKAAGYAQQWAHAPLVIFHCQFSAHRAPTCANAYKRSARPGQRVAIMQGGFNEWECRGLPVNGGGGGFRGAADIYALQAGQAFAYGR